MGCILYLLFLIIEDFHLASSLLPSLDFSVSTLNFPVHYIVLFYEAGFPVL